MRVHSRVMFGLGVLTPLIARFRTLYPDIHVELILAEAQADLRQAQIDIDFRIAPPVEAGLKRRILFKSERHLVASPDYIASMPALTAPPQLADHALICYLKPGEGYVFAFCLTRALTRWPAPAPRHQQWYCPAGTGQAGRRHCPAGRLYGSQRYCPGTPGTPAARFSGNQFLLRRRYLCHDSGHAHDPGQDPGLPGFRGLRSLRQRPPVPGIPPAWRIGG